MKNRFLILSLCFLLIEQTASAQKTEVLTNKAVTDLYKAGFDNAIIISKIEASTCKFDLSTASLLALKKDNVPSDVIKAMMDKTAGKTTAPVANPDAPAKAKQKQMPDIDMMNIPYFYDAHANATIALEKSTAEIKGKITAGSILSPFGGPSDIYLRIDNDKSTVRLSQTDTLSFLVNSEGGPGIFTLYRLNVKKGKREAVYEKDYDSKNKTQSKLDMTTKKLKDNLYQFYPAEKLTPGEYCLVYDYSIARYDGRKVDLYAFGVE